MRLYSMTVGADRVDVLGEISGVSSRLVAKVRVTPMDFWWKRDWTLWASPPICC